MDGGEGLANIAIHSFQLTNQIRNEYHFLGGRKLYSFFVALVIIMNMIKHGVVRAPWLEVVKEDQSVVEKHNIKQYRRRFGHQPSQLPSSV